MEQQPRALSDAELVAIFNDDRADLSLLTSDEQRRLLALTDAKPVTPTPESQGPDLHPYAKIPGKVRDLAVGAAKGAANTALNLGELFYKLPGVSHLSDVFTRAMDVEEPGLTPIPADAAFAQAHQAYATPTNAPQRVGYAAEQIGEYFVPGAQAEKAALTIAGRIAPKARAIPKAIAGAASGAAVSAAQGGDATTAAATGAAVPVLGKAVRATTALAPPLVRSAIKPTVTAMKQQAGASRTGINAQAERLVRFILDHKIASADAAERMIAAAEDELSSLVKGKAVATDAPQRAQRYLAALERSAARQGLPADDVATIRAKAAELIEASPLSETVTTKALQPSPSGLVDPAGRPVMAEVDVLSRRLRDDVTPEEALELARGGGKWGNRKAWGEQKGAAREASKAVERAERDAVKAAIPETKPVLRRQGQAIEAKKVLDRKEFREANREPVSPFDVTTAAVELSQGRAPVLALARAFVRENKLRLGIWAKRLEEAIDRQDVKAAADILGRFGVGASGQIARPATAR